MNIAFLSYEYPEETGGGGIGTYLQLATKLLSEMGHTVTIFAGTKKNRPFRETSSIVRIPAKGWYQFNRQITIPFLAIHKKTPFDVAECTDFNACGLFLKKKIPQLPIVVRLHTPLYIVDRLLFQPMSVFQRIRFILGSLAKRQWPRLPQRPSEKNYREEFEIIKIAEKISSPGQSIYREMKILGFALEDKTEIIPLPFEIPAGILTNKARETIKNDPHIVYIGRLEFRKGVIDLVKAIPQVVHLYPGARFTFVGESADSPQKGTGMTE